MEICELRKEDEKAWDEYVHKHPESTFYHQIGWKNVIQKSYGHKPYYLLAKKEGEIKGVLPLFFMKSPIFGRKLVSVPFAPYGGVLGENSEVEEFLLGRAIEITQVENADYMELRNITEKTTKLTTNSNYITMILKLDKDPDVVWKRFNNKVRNAIRKSLNSNLEINKGNIEDFYKLYSNSMRDLGTPTHSKEFFNAVLSEFQEKAEIVTIWQNTDLLSTAILLYYKDIVISGWAASDKKYRILRPNNLLYWGAIKSGCEKGYKFFDFGRSIEGLGTYSFKKPWGSDEKHLQYVYFLHRTKQMPDTSQINSKRKNFAEIWKRLPPSINLILGPMLRKNIA